MRRRRIGIVLGLLWCVWMTTGCGGAGPLVINKKQPDYAPWCGPDRRVQVGQRVVGYVHDGPKHKEFLVDDKGKEHDPDEIAKQAWSYLEGTGDAKKIEDAFSKKAILSIMPVVSINPVIVIVETYEDAAWLEQPREVAYKDWFWRAQIQPNSNPRFRERMQWFSPDLKQGPSKLTFSEAGVAEIALSSGKLELVRNGDKCKATRE